MHNPCAALQRLFLRVPWAARKTTQATKRLLSFQLYFQAGEAAAACGSTVGCACCCCMQGMALPDLLQSQIYPKPDVQLVCCAYIEESCVTCELCRLIGKHAHQVSEQ